MINLLFISVILWTRGAAQNSNTTETPVIKSPTETGLPQPQCQNGQSGPSCSNEDSMFIHDLKGVYHIDYVMVYNRQDCCLDSIIGAVVELLSKSDDILYTCGTITEARQDYNVSCNSKLGSKVRLRHLKNEPLEYEKIDIFGNPAPLEKVLISRRKPTWQSSNYGWYFSSLAVDGRYESNMFDISFHRNCFHTYNDEMPFWTVDLQGTFKIGHVVLYNRQDCCSDRIVGASIELISEGGEVTHRCGQITESKAVYNISCGNKVAQKVRVRGAARQYLHLCEVEVFGSLSSKPISRGKPTSQSSLYLGLDSSLAVDGKYEDYINKGYSRGNCFHTNNDVLPFWIVDLQGTSNIGHVVLYNRMDCCSERIIGAVVELLSPSGEFKYQCGKITESKRVYNISCGNVNAQMVRIRGAPKQYLHACEVDVFGDSIEETGTVISTRKPTRQSSVYLALDSALAVDGRYENYLMTGQVLNRNCFHTDDDKLPFWLVDLQGTFNIDHVALYNRMDCCTERIVGAVVELLTRDEKVVYECGKVTDSRPYYYMSCGRRIAEKVRVRGAPNQFLHLCEVDVFGEEYSEE